MHNGNDRPSRALFKEPSAQPAPNTIIADSRHTNFFTLQQHMRTSATISQYQLELLKDALDEAGLTRSELSSLKDLAVRRGAENEKSMGWHSGFHDVVLHLDYLMGLTKAA